MCRHQRSAYHVYLLANTWRVPAYRLHALLAQSRAVLPVVFKLNRNGWCKQAVSIWRQWTCYTQLVSNQNNNIDYYFKQYYFELHSVRLVKIFGSLSEFVINADFLTGCIKSDYNMLRSNHVIDVAWFKFKCKCNSIFTCNVSFLNLMHGWYSLVVTQPSTSHQLVCVCIALSGTYYSGTYYSDGV